MKTFRLAALATVLVAGGVQAWQYEDQFVHDQVGSNAGGGGNWSTGSKQDHKVTCAMCHVLPDAGFPSRISVTWGFAPAMLGASDGGSAYAPNTTYNVTVNLVGEHRFPAPLVVNHNGMAATFENSAGQPVGRLRSDTGFSKGGTCLPTLSWAQFDAYDAGSSTVTYAGCNTILGHNRHANDRNRTQWRFQWTSPADAGAITLYYGVVDGDADEKTLGDDALMGTKVLEPGP